MRQDKNEVRDQPVNGNRQPTMFSITREVLKSSIHNFIYVYIYVYQKYRRSDDVYIYVYQKYRRSDADTGLTLVIELFVDLEEEDGGCHRRSLSHTCKHQVGSCGIIITVNVMKRVGYFQYFLAHVVILWSTSVVSWVTPFTPAVTTNVRNILSSRCSTVLNSFTDDIKNDQSKRQFRTDINNGYTGTGGYDPMLSGKSFWRKFILGKRNDMNYASSDKEVNEDGWQEMRDVQLPLWRKVLRLPFKLSFRAIFPKTPVEKEVGTLILVRHGESLWNANKTFTGWADPDLSERGYREVEHAARLILEGGYEIDVVFTSRLKRAIRSVWIILQEMNQVYLPVFKSWRLNERMYGALTGLCKSDTAQRLGAELVQEWRGSLMSRPPSLKTSDVHWPGRDRKYADLTYDEIPLTESLSDCMERCLPIWKQKIMFELRGGKNVLVVAHANTLRGLVKVIDDVSDDDIRNVAIPTG